MGRLLSLFCLLLLFTSGCVSSRNPAAPVPTAGPPVSSPLAVDDASPRALYHFGRARLMLGDGDNEGAIGELRQAIRLDPGSTFLRLSLARLYLESQQEEEAIRVVEAAVAANPGSAEAEVLLGNIHFSHNRYEPAVDHFRRALALSPGEESASMHLGVAYIRAGEVEKAVEVLQAARELHPDSLSIALTLARLYRETDTGSRAEQTYRDILSRDPGFDPAFIELGALLEKRGETEAALQVYRDGLGADPDNAGVRHQVVRLLILLDRPEEAMAELETLVGNHPDDLEGWRKIGLLQLEQQEWAKAAETFSAILEANPALPQARFYLGTALERQDRWQDALAVFRGISPDSSLYPDTLAHVAYLHHRLGETDQAIASLQARLGQPDPRPEIFSFLASLYESEKDFGAAIAALDRGLTVFPDELVLLYEKAIVLERQGDREQAQSLMQEVLRRDPDHAEALNYLAYGYAEEGRNLQDALRMAKRALELKPEGHIADTLGWVYFRLGRFKEARLHLEEAARLLPKDPLVLEHLGDAYHALGLTDQAAGTYNQALELDPAERVRKKLQELR